MMKKFLSLFVSLLMVLTAASAFAEEAPQTELNVAVGSQFTTLDPALNTEVINFYPMLHTFSGLFIKDEDNNAVNELCESYTVSEDALTYTFKIRADAVWSDGVKVTAQDFVYSYLRALSYGADNVWGVNNCVTYVEGAREYNQHALEVGEAFDCTVEDASSVGIKALDDTTLEIKLCTPCPFFIKLLCENMWLPVRADFAPQHESLWAYEGNYPTTGAYTLVECVDSEKCILAKSPTYFNADKVLVDKINFIVITDPSAQAMAFQTGEIDFATSISSETAMMYADTDALWLLPQTSNYFITINSGVNGPEWAKDVNVRRALAMAIDKDALVDVLGGATLFPPLNGYVPTGVSGINGDFRAEGDADGYTLKYDPEEAKRLLSEAGYDESNPLRVAYKYSNNAIHGDVATMLQAMWQAVGIETTFEAVEAGVFYDQVDQGQFEICRYGFVAPDDAMQFLQLWTNDMQVVSAVDDSEYDKLIEAASTLIDPAEYYGMLHKAEDYLCDENAYVVPLFNYTVPVLVKSGINGYVTLGGYPYYAHLTFAE